MSTQIAPTPTLDNATEIAIFLHDLESLDECKCESKHEDPTAPACSVTVVARCITDCNEPDRNWCANRVTEHEQDLVSQDYVCNTCDRPLQDCWRIVAI